MAPPPLLLPLLPLLGEPGVIVTCAEPERVLSASEIAVTVTGEEEGTVAGAV